MIQKEKVLRPPKFPPYSGKLKRMKENKKQRKTSNCIWVAVVKCRVQQYRRESIYRPQSSQYHQNHSSQPRYLKDKLEHNKIGDKGCQQLTKVKWPHLKWIFLCNCTYIQTTTTSLRKAVNTSAKQTGKISNNSLLVNIDWCRQQSDWKTRLLSSESETPRLQHLVQFGVCTITMIIINYNSIIEFN